MSKRTWGWFGVLALVALFASPLFAQDNLVKPVETLKTKQVRSNRLLVQFTGRVTDARVAQLSTYATVHLVIGRYNAVAITPKGPAAEAAIRKLSFVRVVEPDYLVYPIGTGTWDRDIIDTTDVQETGFAANFANIEDPREVPQTGAGVHVAVIDTGLVKNWRDILPESQVDTTLAQAFMGGGALNAGAISNPPNLWERDTNSHGTAVASHIIGFFRNITDGTTVRRVYFDGSAPGATVIPLKVFPNGEAFAWNSHTMAALAYATSLKTSGTVDKLVINMSLGGSRPSQIYRDALNDAIRAGVIVVAAAGNEGEAGMSWPGAFPEVISAGATGWTGQWTPLVTNTWWWTTDVTEDDAAKIAQTFVAPFSSRAIERQLFPDFPAQQLDVLAPGMWTVAPGGHQGTAAYFFWTGTSFSSPLVAGVAALLLEKDGTLSQTAVETILKSTALPIPNTGSKAVFDPLVFGGPGTYSWDTLCGTLTCNAVGAGLVQADKALAEVP